MQVQQKYSLHRTWKWNFSTLWKCHRKGCGFPTYKYPILDSFNIDKAMKEESTEWGNMNSLMIYFLLYTSRYWMLPDVPFRPQKFGFKMVFCGWKLSSVHRTAIFCFAKVMDEKRKTRSKDVPPSEPLLDPSYSSSWIPSQAPTLILFAIRGSLESIFYF